MSFFRRFRQLSTPARTAATEDTPPPSGRPTDQTDSPGGGPAEASAANARAGDAPPAEATPAEARPGDVAAECITPDSRTGDGGADHSVPDERVAGHRRPLVHPLVARLVGWVVTVVAGLLVLFALVAPSQLELLTPAALLRLPIEAVAGLALVLVLPPAVRRVLAVPVGLALALLVILKIFDMGFYSVFARPFDPVMDWTFFRPAVEFVSESYGRAGAIAAVVAAALLTIALLVLMPLAVLRLTRLVVRHDRTAIATLAVLVVVSIGCAAVGVRVTPDVPATAAAYDRALRVKIGVQDQRTFARELAVDAFADTPGDELLTALRGKDVIVAFVESYGRSAVEHPEMATQVGAVLDAGTRRLNKAGYASRSAFLNSPTSGGGSWLAHSTLRSGLWINSAQRYRKLVDSDRLTLNDTFRRANWRTVGVMPGIFRAWPEGETFGYDKVYDVNDLDYKGKRFTFGTMPDQYTLSRFESLERSRPDRPPLMAEIPLISSHGPWAPIPELVDWDDLGDGAIFDEAMRTRSQQAGAWRDATQIRSDYRRSIEYSLNTVISYVEEYGDDDLVLVFLGDHEPAPIVTGENAGRDVPITIVARDAAVFDRISGWGWQDGLRPDPHAPVWPMDSFRDRFLTAFGSRPSQPARPPVPTGR